MAKRRTGRPPVEVKLSVEERARLEDWVRRRKTSQALALRARIVLGCADGKLVREMCAELATSHSTVAKWRRRFVEFRLDGLLDEPRPGAPRKIMDAQVEEVITRTLEARPKNATHWSTRSLAKEVGLSQTAISRIRRAFGLQPHRSEAFKLSTDPLFIEKAARSAACI